MNSVGRGRVRFRAGSWPEDRRFVRAPAPEFPGSEFAVRAIEIQSPDSAIGSGANLPQGLKDVQQADVVEAILLANGKGVTRSAGVNRQTLLVSETGKRQDQSEQDRKPRNDGGSRARGWSAAPATVTRGPATPGHKWSGR